MGLKPDRTEKAENLGHCVNPIDDPLRSHLSIGIAVGEKLPSHIGIGKVDRRSHRKKTRSSERFNHFTNGVPSSCVEIPTGAIKDPIASEVTYEAKRTASGETPRCRTSS